MSHLNIVTGAGPANSAILDRVSKLQEGQRELRAAIQEFRDRLKADTNLRKPVRRAVRPRPHTGLKVAAAG